MFKFDKKNGYQEFLKKKYKFAKKIKQGKKFKDTDNDGLSDYEEKNIYHTDYKNPDTDNDGVKDGDEVKMGRNPLGLGSLKDLFIPHKGNNYLPEVLKPKRLLFHAISLVAIKTVMVVFVLFYPLSAWLSPDLALAQAKKIIELTNNLRQAISLPVLLESQKLNQSAWQKVEDMAINQYFAHISPTGIGLKWLLKKVDYKYSLAGENLAIGFSKPEDVVLAWKNSPVHYNNIIDKDFHEIGVALADGRFNNINTVFIAQHFATQAEEKQLIAVKNLSEESLIKVKPIVIINQTKETQKKVLAINQQKTTLSIKSDHFNKEKALQIKTTLPEDTISAEVVVDNKKIVLEKDFNQTNQWSGVSLINQEEEKNILDPLIPASIAIKNSAGQTAYDQIDWNEVEPIKTSLLEHYQLFKTNPTKAMLPTINLSNFYFQLILVVAFIALLLNIFIEIKKQHAHIIAYNCAFIGLLLIMIIF
ncbi:MAG: CAP domain-containing protein [Patescibacteria group bacterium]